MIMEMRFAKRLAAFLVPVMLLAGCAATQPPVPEDKYYRLQSVPASAPMATPVFPGTLVIERFSADGLTAVRPIVYVEDTGPNQLQEYHYHFWTQQPTVMLRDELVSYLRAMNVAPNIVIPEMRLAPDYVMAGRIRRLEQIRTTSESAAIELEISVRQPNDGKLLFLKSYRYETPQNEGGVAGAVQAMNVGWNQILADLLDDLRKQ